ncbi:MAG: DUF962 domain-containing protein [Isosphaeraceae bacterium]
MSTTTPAGPSWLDRFVANYKEDHRHPVNHFLHLGVGWPLCALGVILLPFRPLWTVGLFVLGYAFMWFGHFVFERNLPTVFTHPTTPFVMAWAVIRGMFLSAWRLVAPAKTRGTEEGSR